MLESDKNIVFTITHGRTGTTMLTEIFKIFDDVLSEHEPEPNYASLLPDVKENPRFSIEFLDKKIDKINGVNQKHYVETSNVFGKGFFIPLVRMGVFPKLILLNREFRKVAESLFKRGSFPMRSKMGVHYSADPSCPGSLPIFQPETLTNYQLCYWGVLDSYWRQLRAADLYDANGKVYVWASTSDFNDFKKTLEIGKYLGLEVSDVDYAERVHNQLSSKHHNPNKNVGVADLDDVLLNDEELEVIDRVAFYEPLFIDKVIESPYFDGGLRARLR